MQMPGTFIISLDFELHWGGFEKWPEDRYQSYFLNTRKVIPEMLLLFHKYDVHVTWASVGMLFFRDKSTLLKNIPKQQPSYSAKELSAYEYMEKIGIGDTEIIDPLHFGGSLVSKILETPNQELGSHTFAHYYCNEAGQTLEQFRADLKSAQQSAQLYNQKLRSLVFPRNQFNEQYLRVCFEEGFIAVRDNPRDWFWNIQSTQSESYWKRLNRGMDAYVAIGKKNTYPILSIARKPGLPLCIPASRLLRPYDPKELFLNDMKITRICSEMERAAMNGEVYHLWWHPHNFGDYPTQSMQALQTILSNFEKCREKYSMNSKTMAEVAQTRLEYLDV